MHRKSSRVSCGVHPSRTAYGSYCNFFKLCSQYQCHCTCRPYNATQLILVAAASGRSNVVGFHNLTVLSSDAEASSEPPWENATAVTESVCPSSFCTSRPVAQLLRRRRNDTHLAQSGVAQPGASYVGYRSSSKSPPSQLPSAVSHTTSFSILQHLHQRSVASGTDAASAPGLTPPSSIQSYTSGQSPLQRHSEP
jgi:hypothetical protein